MKKHTISKKYSFVYKTTNTVNGYIYIGSHTTDNMDDGYLGSGKLLLQAIGRYGVDKFERKVLKEFATHEEAKLLEGQLLAHALKTIVKIYNISTKGSGGNYGDETNAKISETWKDRWVEYYDHLMETCHNPESLAKRSASVKQFYIDNPDAAATRNAVTNRNPEKIRKTAEKHRGMKRTEKTCTNISNAMQESFARRTEDEVAAHVGKDMLYVTNIIDYTYKRVTKDYILQENEMFGMIRDPKLPLKKSAAITNILTWEESIAPAGYILKPTERKGNRKYVRKAINEGKMI